MRIQASQGRLFIGNAPHPMPFPKIRVTDLEKGDVLVTKNVFLADDHTGEVGMFETSGSFLVETMDRKTHKPIPKRKYFVTTVKIDIEPCPDPYCPMCRLMTNDGRMTCSQGA